MSYTFVSLLTGTGIKLQYFQNSLEKCQDKYTMDPEAESVHSALVSTVSKAEMRTI